MSSTDHGWSTDLEQQISGEMRAGNVPALALAMVRGDVVIYARGFGSTSVEGAVTPHTLFRIGLR